MSRISAGDQFEGELLFEGLLGCLDKMIPAEADETLLMVLANGMGSPEEACELLRWIADDKASGLPQAFVAAACHGFGELLKMRLLRRGR